MSIRECPFCENTSEIIAENAVGYAILDGFPVSKGHDLPPKAVPHSMLVPGVEQVVPEWVSRGADEA
jgi:diadenosine tetraphosphate (Ap4A) HIT family hydrolase